MDCSNGVVSPLEHSDLYSNSQNGIFYLSDKNRLIILSNEDSAGKLHVNGCNNHIIFQKFKTVK